MNILPKKRWHVRTKENIARVKEDEAKHAEEQRQIKYRALLADQEARTEVLRKKFKRSSDALVPTTNESDRSALLSSCSGNKEYEAEKKAEQESKEKAIGLLTYLGQSVKDSGGEKPWYDMHPKQLEVARSKSKDKIKEEWEAKKKARADPLNEMNKVSEWFENRREQKAREEAKTLLRATSCIAAMPSLFPNDISVPKSSRPVATISKPNEKDPEQDADNEPSASNHQSSRHSGSTSSAIEMAKQLRLDALRAERLQRERKERERAAVVMAKAMGLDEALRDPADSQPAVDERRLPFNSAFNPELAASLAEQRQRYRESRKRRAPRD